MVCQVLMDPHALPQAGEVAYIFSGWALRDGVIGEGSGGKGPGVLPQTC